jgi:hypothetical protein
LRQYYVDATITFVQVIPSLAQSVAERSHFSGIPALRSPTEYVASDKAQIFGTAAIPAGIGRPFILTVGSADSSCIEAPGLG